MPSRDRCSLRLMNEADLPLVLQWRNSQRVRQFMFSTHIISEDEHQSWWQRASIDRASRHYVFEVDGRPVGVVNFVEMDEPDGTAAWGLYLGADDTEPGTGSAMAWFALSEAFGPLGVRKLLCDVFASNEVALGLYEKVGFQREGVRRAHRFHDDRYEDVVELALFADDWSRIAEELAPVVFRG